MRGRFFVICSVFGLTNGAFFSPISAQSLPTGPLQRGPAHTPTPRAVHGTVRDSVSGEPIPDALVTVRGTLLQSRTDAMGRFALRIDGGTRATVHVSRLGFTPRTVQVVAPVDSIIQVRLAPIAQRLAAAEVVERRVAERRSEPIGMVVVDREEIDRFDDQSIADVLRRQAGLVMGGPPGAAKDVRMRGLDKEYTQVLVDGRRFPDGGEKREFNVDRVSAALVERVEIRRGPSATLPAQGVGGTVNVVMRDVPIAPLLETGWTAGRAGTGAPSGDAFLVAGDSRGRFGWLVDGALMRRDAPAAGKDRTLTSGRETDSESLDTQTMQFMPRATWRATARDLFVFEPSVFDTREAKGKRKERLDASGALTAAEFEDEDKTRGSYRLRTQYKRNMERGGMLRADLGVQRAREDKVKQRDVRNKVGTTTLLVDEVEDKADTEQFALVEWTPQVAQHHLTFGAEQVRRDRFKAKRVLETKGIAAAVDKTGPKDVYAIDEGMSSLWGQTAWYWTAQRVVTAGIRAEHVNNRAVDRRGEVSGQRGWVVAPSMHLLQQHGSWNARASVARSVRRPKFDDLIPYLESRSGTLAAPDRMGNPALRPEQSTGFEVGVERFFGAGGVLGVSTYRKRIDGVTATRIIPEEGATARYVEQPINVGQGTLDGVDLDLRATLSRLHLPTTTLYATASHFRGRLRLVDGSVTRFPNQPDYVVNAGFDHLVRRWGVSVGANANRVPGISKNEIKEGAANLASEDIGDRVDAYVAWRVRKFDLRLSGQNLLAAGKEKRTQVFDANGRVIEVVAERESAPRFFYLGITRRF